MDLCGIEHLSVYLLHIYVLPAIDMRLQHLPGRRPTSFILRRLRRQRSLAAFSWSVR